MGSVTFNTLTPGAVEIRRNFPRGRLSARQIHLKEDKKNEQQDERGMLKLRDGPDQHICRFDLCGGIGYIKLRLRRIREDFPILLLQPAFEIAQITGLGDHFLFQGYGFDEFVSDIHQEIHGVGFETKVVPMTGGVKTTSTRFDS